MERGLARFVHSLSVIFVFHLEVPAPENSREFDIEYDISDFSSLGHCQIQLQFYRISCPEYRLKPDTTIAILGREHDGELPESYNQCYPFCFLFFF